VLVTIFGSGSFPVSEVSLRTVRLGAAPVREDRSKDVDGDGQPDLVLHFKLSEIALAANGEVCIEGRTLSGLSFAGCGTLNL
jgi:hypothetical protein